MRVEVPPDADPGGSAWDALGLLACRSDDRLQRRDVTAPVRGASGVDDHMGQSPGRQAEPLKVS